MNTEQERAAFEAWYASRHETYDTTFIYYTPENRYQRPSVDESWSAYQAGRAALQSQDREDAERLDWVDMQNARFKMGMDIGFAPVGNMSIKQIVMGGKPIREAIDHARRIEGDGD